MDSNSEVQSFIDVIVPVPIPQYFTYRVPREGSSLVKPGVRVVVEFGKSRVVTAIVTKVHNQAPQNYQAKYILEILDEQPVVTQDQIWLFNWVAEYYMCTVGEVLNVALPSGLKISSQSKIQYNPDFNYYHLLNDLEKNFLQILLTEDSLTYEEVSRFIDKQDPTRFIKGLIAKHAVILFEEISEKYKPKIEKKISLDPLYESDEEIIQLIENLGKAKKQQDVVLKYLSFIPIDELKNRNVDGVWKTDLKQQGVSDSALSTLIQKGIFRQTEVAVSRFEKDDFSPDYQLNLSPAQQKASVDIMDLFAEKEVVLFHGITGSGKTEVYIDIIRKALDSGTQVLFLLPEIALTTQIVRRLKLVFGDVMGVYHSKFSDNERVEVWDGVLKGQFQFIVGVRSAIFLPFNNLGLIIVDEEHDSSYKQFDPAPRYHARDMAIMLATRIKARVLLGSATPSIETYYQALQGKFGLVSLNERYGEATLPEIQLVNLREERQNKTMTGDFSSMLLDGLKTNLERKKQTMIFLNRRGYAPYITCQTCNWIPYCEQCSVTLTYHLRDNTLVCHYCGHSEPNPKTCQICGSATLKSVGLGTERIEDDLRTMYPDAHILRMDLDTTRTKNAYENIINEFEKGDVDILVGTQMISKGFDFDRVSLVGVFSADRLIHYPDFRSAERAFQLITQVSGRSGRRGEKGKVLIQTANPQNRVLQFILNDDYVGFYQSEIQEREMYNYPPFSRMIEITVKDEDQVKTHQVAEHLAANLKKFLGVERVMGPERGLVERIRNKFHFQIWLKLEKDKLNIQATKKYLQKEIVNLITENKYKSIRIVVNVDAV